MGQSADGDSEESVTLTNPAAGTYTVQVDGYAVPAGTTEYDYLDVFFSSSLGSLTVPATAIDLASGASTPVSGDDHGELRPRGRTPALRRDARRLRPGRGARHRLGRGRLGHAVAR